MKKIIPLIILLIFILGCTPEMIDKTKIPENAEQATFAGGCFWCMEAAFQEIEGVIDVISGYSGGTKENPSYQEVSSGKTGHVEAINITYDPSKISYKELIDLFWKQIDPTDAGGQFTDRGPQYQTAIFYHNEDQKRLAEESKKELVDSGKFDKPIATKILPFDKFFDADESHQDYYIKRTIQYRLYETGSGRKRTLKKIWEQ